MPGNDYCRCDFRRFFLGITCSGEAHVWHGYSINNGDINPHIDTITNASAFSDPLATNPTCGCVYLTASSSCYSILYSLAHIYFNNTEYSPRDGHSDLNNG